MLGHLSIRDIVLIEKLDLNLEEGLGVLTGETGAGKSILLDSLGLALGARGDASLVRSGCDKGSVTASFHPPAGHAAYDLLASAEIDTDNDGIVIRRIQGADGKSRVFINDQPSSVNLLRQLGGLLAEIHGQHDDRALMDVSFHRTALDAYGELVSQVHEVEVAWKALSAAREAYDAHQARLDRAETERTFIEHALKEMHELDPQPGEEALLADKRQLMMNAEEFASVVNEAQKAVNNNDTIASLNTALRKLERRREAAQGALDPLCAALERAVIEMNEAQNQLDAAAREFVLNPAELERAEERLFALRALARKHKVQVDDLADLMARFEADLQSIDDGGMMLGKLRQARDDAQSAYDHVARKLSDARAKAAIRLDEEILTELGPLRLEKARFETRVETDASRAASHGIDRVEFLIAANPGTPLAPIVKAASGGELSRFLLALKVVLAARASAPTLVFDEIDTGVGGAVADAIGQRLSRMSKGLQVLAVTHSPQVASRADAHLLISKMEETGDAAGRRMITRVTPLSGEGRREEIARMLSGAEVTSEARAQADRLLQATG
ncbi:MAG: DNA repair protein RecN [Anderseniella sp.]